MSTGAEVTGTTLHYCRREAKLSALNVLCFVSQKPILNLVEVRPRLITVNPITGQHQLWKHRMRPDTRSFSFTWLRGQQHTEELNLGRPNTRSQTVGRGPTNVLTGASILTNSEVGENDLQPQAGSSTGGLSLRRFGSSFLRNVTNTRKYASIGEGEDEEEAAPVDDMEVDNSVKDEQNSSGSTAKSTLSLGKRLNKTVQDVKNTLGSISQRFRKSTRRRYRMTTPGSAQVSPTRRILGRTPTKLYSPFGFDSPLQKTPKRLGMNRPSPRRGLLTPGRTCSPNFRKDVKDVRRGLEEFHMISRDITRRSVRF